MAIGTGTAIALGLGAALGGAKGIANKKANARDRKIRAATVEYSPWTGLRDPGETQRPGMLDSIAQGTLSGAIAGQALHGLGGSALVPSGPGLATSALGQDVLNQQMLTNPYLQRSSWAGLNPGIYT